MSRDLLVAMIGCALGASVLGAVLPVRPRRYAVAVATMAACACAFAASAGVLGSGHDATLKWTQVVPLTGFWLVLDPLGALFVATAAVVALAASIFSLGYHGHGLASRTASAILPLFVMSLLIVPAAGSVATFFLLWELMAVTSLLLVLVDHRRRPEVQVAGQWYAVMTQIGATAILLALIVLGVHSGAMSFEAIRRHAPLLSPAVRDGAFVLALAGFGSKAGAVPLHVWLPRAHPEAPSPISALMSAAMVNLGVYGIVRVGVDLLGGGPAWWWLVVMTLGALSALFGALHSATSTDLKRLLAYSTTDNVGLMLLGVGASGLFESSGHRALAVVAMTAALLHLVFHAVFKGSLFLSAGSIQQATGTRDLDLLGGLTSRMPATGIVFVVGGLAIAALPPFCGFVSEWLLLQSMLHGLPSTDPAIAITMPLSVAVLALTGGLTAASFVKAIGIGVLGLPRSEGARRSVEVAKSMRLGAGLLAALCVVLGVAPYLVLPAVLRASDLALATPGLDPLRRGWSVGLAGTHNLLAPGLLAASLAVAVGAVAALRRVVQRVVTRRAEAWGCGRELQTARMEYTATSFAEPLVRVFDDVLRPDHDLDVSHTAESRYYVESIEFHSTLDDTFERHLYKPVAVALAWWGDLARRLQNGSIHRYLAFGLGALVVVLVVLA